MDNGNDDNWYEHLHDDDSVIYPIDTYNMAFDDVKEAERLLSVYQHKTMIKDFAGTKTLTNAEHLLYAACDDVGLIAGGEEMEVLGRKRKYTEAEIETAYQKWFEY